MKRSDVPYLVTDLTKLAEALARPCTCGRRACTLGDHVWSATLDLRHSGPRAQNTEPSTRRPPGPSEPSLDRTPRALAALHLEYRAALDGVARSLATLEAVLGSVRPDRRVGLVVDETTTSADWCRHHFDQVGIAVPRYRGDLCQWCYRFQLAERTLPPRDLLRAKEEGRKITTAMVDASLEVHRPRPTSKRARKRARRSSGGHAA